MINMTNKQFIMERVLFEIGYPETVIINKSPDLDEETWDTGSVMISFYHRKCNFIILVDDNLFKLVVDYNGLYEEDTDKPHTAMSEFTDAFGFFDMFLSTVMNIDSLIDQIRREKRYDEMERELLLEDAEVEEVAEPVDEGYKYDIDGYFRCEKCGECVLAGSAKCPNCDYEFIYEGESILVDEDVIDVEPVESEDK